jgi:uncharacterized protein YoxC
MTLLLGICAVVVTVAFVALVVAAIKALNRFGDTAAQLEQTARRLDESIAGVQSVTREAHELIASVGQVVPHVKRTVEQFEGVGNRAVGLSQALLNEVAIPVNSAVRLFRSVRMTAGTLLERLARREHATANNGGYTP